LSSNVPILDLKTVASVSSWILFLWPAVPVAAVAALRWKFLASRISFLVLGYFVCLGVQAIARTIGYTFVWFRFVGASAPDRVLISVIDASLSVVAVAAVLSIGPVIWLARICARIDGRAVP